jgi:hypothetical protein
MHWVLQDTDFSERGWDTLIHTLETFGVPFTKHKVTPFIGTLTPEPDIGHNNVICFGSYSMRHSANLYGWNPGVFDVGPHDFTVQKSHWGDKMLNADSEVMEFKDVHISRPTFIRPVDDTKFFSGAVFEPEYFEDWQRKVVVSSVGMEGISLSPTALVQVSPVKEIWSEYRFWVVQGRIVTASRYKLGTNVIYSNDVDYRFHEFVQGLFDGFPERLMGWRPAEAFVIDVCETPKGIKIVEINTINSSGFYAADVQKLVFALENAFNEHGSRL